MDGTAMLAFGVLFSAIGLGYLVYARRQNAPVPLIAGLALIFFPYFMPNLLFMLVVGAALMAAPHFIRV